jgi:four helix bundle protein
MFGISKSLSKEENYSLIDQISFSSRSVISSIPESWVSKHYVKSLINKLTDSLREEHITEVIWFFNGIANIYLMQFIIKS